MQASRRHRYTRIFPSIGSVKLLDKHIREVSKSFETHITNGCALRHPRCRCSMWSTDVRRLCPPSKHMSCYTFCLLCIRTALIRTRDDSKAAVLGTISQVLGGLRGMTSRGGPTIGG